MTTLLLQRAAIGTIIVIALTVAPIQTNAPKVKETVSILDELKSRTNQVTHLYDFSIDSNVFARFNRLKGRTNNRKTFNIIR